MVIILRGISGSGKSSLVRGRGGSAEAYDYLHQLDDDSQRIVLSADDWFLSADGGWFFDPAKLGEAHSWCLKRFLEGVIKTKATLIIDNTNCSIAEVAPYAAVALAIGQPLHIITLVGAPDKCWRRNKHEVSFDSVLRQDIALRRSLEDWPPWFPQRIFPSE